MNLKEHKKGTVYAKSQCSEQHLEVAEMIRIGWKIHIYLRNIEC